MTDTTRPDGVTFPSVPNEVMQYIHAYGDSRADDDGMSALRIGETVLALRRWAAALTAPASKPTGITDDMVDVAAEKLCELEDGCSLSDLTAEEADYMRGLARGVVQAALSRAKPAEGGVREQPKLKVRVTSFPESNGRRNWTALLTREEPWDGLPGNCGGITIDRGEYWNRVAYEAERARFLLGQRDSEPHILDYGDDIKTPDEWRGEARAALAPQGEAK